MRKLNGWMMERMDGKDDHKRTKPGILYMKIDNILALHMNAYSPLSLSVYLSVCVPPQSPLPTTPDTHQATENKSHFSSPLLIIFFFF
jgi:hypothetical protein